MISLALILGLGLRLISLNQSLWLDEATSALTTKMSLRYFFFQFITGDFHPPLYYLTLRPWSTLFGSSEIALRSLSVLFGTATIYLVYLIGRKMFNEEVGIITALLLATSSLHVYYSQEARMYSMSAFLVCLAIYLFLKISKAKSSPKDWIIFSLIIGLIGLTDYLSLLILPVFWIFAILTKQKSQWWKKFSISQFVSVALLLPWLPTFVKQLTSGINVTNNSPAWTSVLGILSIK